jgi:sorbitol/mannitol transport system permease protein
MAGRRRNGLPSILDGAGGLQDRADAIASPPLLFFTPTLENFAEMQQRVDYLAHAWNSIAVSFGSTILAVLIATPAAYSIAFFPTRRARSVLLWMLSTKFMPAAGVLVPIYLLLISARLLDTRTGLLLITLLSNLPLVLWLLYSYFKEISPEIVEMARMDGARPLQQMRFLLLPLAAPGVASTALLAIILSWNESFWCINVTAVNAGTLAVAIASFSNPEGFWAKLGRVARLDGADHGLRLAHPAPPRAWPYLRGGQLGVGRCGRPRWSWPQRSSGAGLSQPPAPQGVLLPRSAAGDRALIISPSHEHSWGRSELGAECGGISNADPTFREAI